MVKENVKLLIITRLEMENEFIAGTKKKVYFGFSFKLKKLIHNLVTLKNKSEENF